MSASESKLTTCGTTRSFLEPQRRLRNDVHTGDEIVDGHGLGGIVAVVLIAHEQHCRRNAEAREGCGVVTNSGHRLGGNAERTRGFGCLLLNFRIEWRRGRPDARAQIEAHIVLGGNFMGPPQDAVVQVSIAASVVAPMLRLNATSPGTLVMACSAGSV
jgi:hypothetical protein